MRTFSLFAALTVIVGTAGFGRTGPTNDGKAEPGFTPLFNGKDLDGWKEAGSRKAMLAGQTQAFDGRFKVAGGKLIYDPAVKGDRYIETTREFGKDVHIKLDFRPGAKCNNDVFLRGTKFDIIPGNRENAKVKEGEWYTLEIVVTGDKVEHRINGEMVRTSRAGPRPTPLKLRAEFGAIEVKNIRAKEP
jgi:hypothetical protein